MELRAPCYENRVRGVVNLSCWFELKGYLEPQSFQAMDWVPGQVMLVKVIQVEVAEVVVGDILGQDVIDGD